MLLTQSLDIAFEILCPEDDDTQLLVAGIVVHREQNHAMALPILHQETKSLTQ